MSETARLFSFQIFSVPTVSSISPGPSFEFLFELSVLAFDPHSDIAVAFHEDGLGQHLAPSEIIFFEIIQKGCFLRMTLLEFLELTP